MRLCASRLGISLPTRRSALDANFFQSLASRSTSSMRMIGLYFVAIILSACAASQPDPQPVDHYRVAGKSAQGPQEGARLIAERENLVTAGQFSSEADRAPKLIRSVAPVMPRAAIELGIQGAVRAELVIEPDGTVSSVKILQSPDALLSQAVTAAMKQWAFSPLIVQGVATRFTAVQSFRFQIEP